MSSRAPRLETRDLSVHFGSRSALSDISVQFRAGETVAILGPNGAGKSTLLKCLAGILPPTHGGVLLEGATITAPSNRVVYVPQRSGVDWSFPISVLDVVLMGAPRSGIRLRAFSAAERRTALDALVLTGMERLANIQIGQLSGGQQQRVFLARALQQDGDVYLMDEPFTGVDSPTQRLLAQLFNTLRDQGKTMIYATHDLVLAAETSDRLLLINREVVADGPPATTMTAAALRATFGGQAILPVTGLVS